MNSTLLNLAIIIILSSCRSSEKSSEIEYTDFVEKNVFLIGRDSTYDLKDSLGSIHIRIPQRLDTFYYWHDPSDCSPCGWMKYRFSDKTYPQFAESGWMWNVVPDSTYQLNIWHKPIRVPPDTIVMKSLSEKDTSFCYYHPRLVSHPGTANFLFKEFRIINEKSFVLSAFVVRNGYLTNSQTLFVIAETTLKSRELYFIGECGAKDTTGFIKNMYKSFHLIRITEIP